MTPEEFKNTWITTNEPLNPLSVERLNRFDLNPETKYFLIEAGLPTFTEPVLRFANDTDDFDYGISKLIDLYDFEEDRKEFDKYVVIGFCRDGDPIVINTDEDDLIEELDHEDGFSPMFFNSSINALAEFLIIYRDFEYSILSEYGKQGIQNSYFNDDQFNLLRKRMLLVDNKALTEEGFWKDELEILISLRQ